MSTPDQDNKGKPFIPRQLDDYGLTPAQFRVVGRIARRGKCEESIPNMASGCRLNPKTVKAALPRLVALKILRKEKRRGETSVYRVAPPTEWLPSRYAPQGQTAAQVAKRTASKTKPAPDHPGQTDTQKGNPLEGNPKKGGGAKLFPHEVMRWITDIKTQIKRTPAADTKTLEGLYGKLESLEAEYYGSPVTTRPSPVEARPPVVSASAKPAEAMRKMTDEDIQQLKAAVEGREPGAE